MGDQDGFNRGVSLMCHKYFGNHAEVQSNKSGEMSLYVIPGQFPTLYNCNNGLSCKIKFYNEDALLFQNLLKHFQTAILPKSNESQEWDKWLICYIIIISMKVI